MQTQKQKILFSLSIYFLFSLSYSTLGEGMCVLEKWSWNILENYTIVKKINMAICSVFVKLLALGFDFTFTWRIIPRPLLDNTMSTLGLYHVHFWFIPRPPLNNTRSIQNPHLACIRRKGPTCFKIWSSILLCDSLLLCDHISACSNLTFSLFIWDESQFRLCSNENC